MKAVCKAAHAAAVAACQRQRTVARARLYSMGTSAVFERRSSSTANVISTATVAATAAAVARARYVAQATSDVCTHAYIQPLFHVTYQSICQHFSL